MSMAVAESARYAADYKWTRIVAAGLTGGMVDVVYFSTLALVRGSTPVRVLQSIASFWLGPDSSKAGAVSAALGLATHFGLACIMAAGFALIRMTVRALPRSPYISGPLYGLLLYAIMYYAVMPLRWPSIYPRFDRWTSILDILVHVAIGTVFALMIGRDAARSR